MAPGGAARGRVATTVDPRGDTGAHERPAPPVEPGAPPGRRRPDAALLVVWGMTALWAAVFSWLSMLRYRGFSTGRFDLGNMVQAVWSTSEGRFLETTDVSGIQFTRLGAHVDLILVLFVPLWAAWPSPEALLVAQAVIVSLGALPAYWLGRRWLGDPRLAVAGAAVYLLFPALQSATLFDFHPVTLAAPLLLWCIWAAEEARWLVLGVCAGLALITQEQVGLLLAALAVWLWFRHPGRRRAAAVLAVASLAWVAVAIGLIMPHFAIEGGNPHINRYSRLGEGPGEMLTTVLTRPWEAVALLLTPGRVTYLVLLMAPLLLLPLAAPLLAAVAVPQLLINLFASWGPAQSVQYHYAVLLVPPLVAASLLGLANLRARPPEDALGRLASRTGLVAGLVVGAIILPGVWQGPLPLWGWVPGGWGGSPLHAFTVTEDARAIQGAVDLIPPGEPVSATNDAGSHLSARRRIHLFPVLRDANWALVSDGRRAQAIAEDRPTLRPTIPLGIRPRSKLLQKSVKWRLVYEERGIRLYRRIASVPPGEPIDPSDQAGEASRPPS
jgi:uncharacterized membrane protein